MSVHPPFLLLQVKNLLKISRNKVTEISSVEGFWESLHMEGISGNSAKLISHSSGKSQTTAYELVSGLAGVIKDKLIFFKHL